MLQTKLVQLHMGQSNENGPSENCRRHALKSA